MFNRYSYAINNPVTYTDPDGRCIGPFIIPCGAVAVGGGAVAVGGTATVMSGSKLAVTTLGAIILHAAIENGKEGDDSGDAGEEASEPDASPDGEVNIGDKVGGQLGDRGWTEEEVGEITAGEPSGTSTDNTNGESEPASVYGDPSGHVIVNDKTGEVIQVSDKTDPDWIPDSRIKWND